jgi:multiple sugar transport system substrate-binding protein
MRKLFALALAAGTCLTSAMPAFAADVEINYWMWDGNQSPVYRQCADRFEAENPGIRIKITQDGWDNYWTTLTTGFISGTAPDVFVNHISRFPELLANGVMVDLTDRIAADKVDMGAYKPGLAESWNKDGHQWGLPKDWDTIALVYNRKMLADAGITEDQIQNLTWNPDDGGSFQTVMGKLAVDADGKHGGEAGFDKSRVDVFGFATDAADGYGQSQWSFFAVSAGFRYIDKPWGTRYFYDSPILARTLTWMRDLALDKGYSVSQEQAGNLGSAALFAAGKAAVVPAGSWTINTLKDSTPFDFGFAPLPIGPDGRRSMFNGLADSIWTGSRHQDEAWAWVKYLGSAECQDIVGKAGIVFPARPEATEAAKQAHADQGIDVSAYTLVATPETTFPFPITDYGNQISTILNTAVNKVLLDQGDPAEILKSANDEVNALF